MKRVHYYYLIGALLLGLMVRLPGIFWGFNFPAGWHGHHPDEYTHLVNTEMLINPTLPPRWDPHPYPKGLAAHVAVPFLGLYFWQGTLFDGLPTHDKIIVGGRIISALYGAATIFIVFLLARHISRDPRVALFAAWILALGGSSCFAEPFFCFRCPSNILVFIRLLFSIS